MQTKTKNKTLDKYQKKTKKNPKNIKDSIKHKAVILKLFELKDHLKK